MRTAALSNVDALRTKTEKLSKFETTDALCAAPTRICNGSSMFVAQTCSAKVWTFHSREERRRKRTVSLYLADRSVRLRRPSDSFNLHSGVAETYEPSSVAEFGPAGGGAGSPTDCAVANRDVKSNAVRT